MHYRRPDPVIKSTKEKELYGTLSELEITKEDWVIIDPKENNIRETATSNLIFVKEEGLLIPDKWVLNGIVLQQLLPFLKDRFTLTSGFLRIRYLLIRRDPSRNRSRGRPTYHFIRTWLVVPRKRNFSSLFAPSMRK